MIGIRLVGDADRKIRVLATGVSDLRLFWPRLVPVVTGWWKRQFATEGAFGGRPWAPLTTPYALTKSRKAPGKPLLVFRSGIKRAAARPSRVQSPRSMVLTIDDADYPHGSKGVRNPILQYHQEGEGHNPARPLVFGEPLPREAEAELIATAETYLTDLLRRLG
jgi:hypothetical protein